MILLRQYARNWETKDETKSKSTSLYFTLFDISPQYDKFCPPDTDILISRDH